MTTLAELQSRIEDPHAYNFRDLLTTRATEAPEEPQISNTTELFAFGGVSSYARNPQSFVHLSETGKSKLAQLSVLSVLNSNVGNEVPFGDVMAVVAPFIEDPHTLESVLISMVDAGTVRVKIDEEKHVIRVDDTPVLRDAYNENSYQLKILKDDDLMVMPLGRAREILRKWLRESIVPAKQEFDT